jgi:hypothetical protein
MISIILIFSLHVVRNAVILHHFREQGLNVAHILIIDFAGVLFGKVFNCHVVNIPHASDKSKGFFVFIYCCNSLALKELRARGWPAGPNSFILKELVEPSLP